VLVLDLVGNKSLFASRQGLPDFAQACDVARPEDVVCEQVQALEPVPARRVERDEQAVQVVAAIRLGIVLPGLENLWLVLVEGRFGCLLSG